MCIHLRNTQTTNKRDCRRTVTAHTFLCDSTTVIYGISHRNKCVKYIVHSSSVRRRSATEDADTVCRMPAYLISFVIVVKSVFVFDHFVCLLRARTTYAALYVVCALCSARCRRNRDRLGFFFFICLFGLFQIIRTVKDRFQSHSR